MQETPIGPHVDLLSGFAFSSEDYTESPEAIRLLRGDNVAQGRIRWLNAKRWPIAKLDGLDKFFTEEGDLVIAMDRTWVSSGLKVSVVRSCDTPSLLVQRVARLRAKPGLHQTFLPYVFSTHRFEQYVKGSQTETAVPHISSRQIREFPVWLPPEPEQARIAEILGTWDAAIDTIERLIENSKRQKKALMQQLLTGQTRLPGFDAVPAWRTVHFHEIFERVRRKNSSLCDNVLTISAQEGLVNQESFFNKRVASDNLENYTLLDKGEFAYNKSYSAGYPLGAIKPLEKYDQGVVSSLYICFALSSETGHQPFFRHYFEAGVHNREIYAIAQEGARNHGLLNVSVHDFFQTLLNIPERDEQVKIAELLNQADEIIENYEAQAIALKAQKKALMQQLLTGKRRVSVAEHETPRATVAKA